MNLADLLEALRVDLADAQASLFSDADLMRCLQRATLAVIRDLGLDATLNGQEMQGQADANTQEFIILLARINACQIMRTRTAGAFSFGSGDKRIDKTKEPEQWAKLQKDLKAEYAEKLEGMRGLVPQDTFVFPTPVIYEQGRHA